MNADVLVLCAPPGPLSDRGAQVTEREVESGQVAAAPVTIAVNLSRVLPSPPMSSRRAARRTGMPTADLDSVQMWYDQRGAGDPCVLLHPGGAGVDSRALTPNSEALAEMFTVYTPEQRGHGHTRDVDGPVSYELMAQDTIRFIETVIGGPVLLVGCSDGAVVALLAALARPDLVRRLVLAAGVFHRDGWAEGVLDGEPPGFLRESYGEVSPDGPGHYDVVAAKLADMHAREPALTAGDLARVTCRTLVMVADDDEVRLEHAIEMYRGLPDAELAVVPGTSHGLLVEKPSLCNLLITEFLTKDPVLTYAPIRRAPGHQPEASQV